MTRADSQQSVSATQAGDDEGFERNFEVPAADSTLLPCSFTQRRVWFGQWTDPQSCHWNVAMRYRITGRVSDAVVDRAWHTLQARHEALRTTFEDVDGLPVQRVWAALPLKVAHLDLSRFPADSRESAAEDIARREAMKPIALGSHEPALRVHHLRLDDEHSILLVTYHNIIVDGWSLGIVIQEFGRIAADLQAGRQPDLPPPSLQYADYALWHTDLVESGSLAEERAYWRRRLAGWKRFEVSPDRPRPEVQTHNGDIRTILLPAPLSDAFLAFTSSGRYSPFHVTAAALAAALVRSTGNSDVVIGTQAACRDEPELETMVGPTTNTLALRFDLAGDPTLGEVLGHCRERTLEALANQRIPFNFVVEDLRPPRDPSRSAVYSVHLVTQAAHINNGETGALRYPGLQIETMPSFSAGAPTDLYFFAVGRENGWRLSCAGNSDLFDVTTVDRLLAHWAETLEALVEDGGRSRISDRQRRARRAYEATGVTHRRTGAEPQGSAIMDDATNVPPAAEVPAHARAVIAIWQDVLGRSDIDIETDFFDAGGTSLAMLQMLARVNRQLGCKVPLAKVLVRPKLADLVALVAPEGSPVEPTTGNGKREPAGGPAGSSRPAARAVELVRHVAPVRQILALNNGYAFALIGRAMAAGLPIVDVPVGDAEDTAFAAAHDFSTTVARVTRRITTAQPEGPYVLMAYCGLGVVAAEAARQLEADGREVRLLIMLNAMAPGYVDGLSLRGRMARRRRQLSEAIENFKVLLAMRHRGEITTGVLLEHYSVVRRLRITSLLRRLRLIEATPPQNDYVESFAFFEHLKKANAAHLAKRGGAERLTADIAVFRTTDVMKGPSFPIDLGWAPLTRGAVHVHDVEGRHIEMLRAPCATAIGSTLDGLLRGRPKASIWSMKS